MANSAQNLVWRRHAPELFEVRDAPSTYWWARGWDFNRPVIVRVNAGVRQSSPSEAASSEAGISARISREFRAELNFEFFADGMSNVIWNEQLTTALPGLQWAGPINLPKEPT